MHARTLVSLLALGLALAGCRTGKPPRGGDILTDAARRQIPGHWSAAHGGGNVVPGWIRSFNDPVLTRTVEDAIARNPDLKAAAARVEASRAAVRIAAASLYPRAALKGLGERQGQELSGTLGGTDPPTLGALGIDQSGGSQDTRNLDASSQRWIYGLGIGASWELDVWGRVRSKKAAAKSDSLALEADYEFARQSLAASVARAYFSVIEASQQAGNARETLKLYQEYLKLTDVRKQQGFSSDFELAQVRSRTAAAQDTLHAAEAARAQAIRAIEVVTSHYPAGRKTVRSSFPGTSLKPVPSGLPAQLLERRPDLVAAERRFAAAFHRTNEARAARLPRFAISAAGGLAAASLDNVGILDAVNWSLAAGAIQPIFFGGELKAAQDLRTSEQRAAAADYAGAALRAFQDVEDALASEYYLRKRESALAEMVSSSADAVKLGRIQLDQGQTDMFTILRLVGENLAAKIELTKVRASRLRERANLHLALGGGFSADNGR